MKKKIRIFVLLALIVIVLSISLAYILKNKSFGHKKIKVSGNIEATDVRLSFRVGGQIEELLADEGMSVKAGQAVARLNTDELTKIKNEAAASLKAAEYSLSLSKDDYVRAENLFNVGSISAQKRDEAKTRGETSQANVDALRASLELADTRLGFAELDSPINGFVLVKSAEQGEVIQTGATVFTAADLNDIWLTAYINETELGRVKLNQEANIKTDTYPRKIYKGRISFISQQAEFTPKQIQTSEERVKLVYRIKIKLENPNLELKPGMPADGYIIE